MLLLLLLLTIVEEVTETLSEQSTDLRERIARRRLTISSLRALTTESTCQRLLHRQVLQILCASLTERFALLTNIELAKLLAKLSDIDALLRCLVDEVLHLLSRAEAEIG